MTVRAITNVKKGQELCLSYVDLYQPRQQRQEELLATKHFECKCDRCATPIEASPDRMLNGFSCQEKGCKGVLIPTRPATAHAQKQQLKPKAGGGRGKGKGGKGKGKGDPKEKEEKKAEAPAGVELLWCDVCGQSEKREKLRKHEEDGRFALQRQTLQANELPKKCEELEKLLKETRLHPLHASVFSIRILLINLYDKLNDNVNSIRYAQSTRTHAPPCTLTRHTFTRTLITLLAILLL